MQRTLALSLFLSLPFAFAGATGCSGGTDAPPADMAQAAPDMRRVIPFQDLGPESLDGGAPVPTTAVVTTSSFMTFGSIHTVRLADQQVTPSIDTTIGQDHSVRAAEGRVFVVDRAAGTLRVYDPANGYKSPVEARTGTMAVPAAQGNPHDALPIPATTKVYVALYGNDAAHAVGVIDTARPQEGVVEWIPVPASAGSNLPRANELWFCGGLAYVTLQDLDASYGATGPGRIAVIDPATDSVVATDGIITLAGWNPGGSNVGSIARSGAGCDQILVANSGDLGSSSPTFKMHANLEKVDLTRRRSDGVLFEGAALGGAPGIVSTASPTLAFVTVNMLPAYTQKVVAVNPQTKTVLGDATDVASFIAFAQVSPDGKLYVGVASRFDMNLLPVGLYVGAADGKKLTASAIDLGQAPYGISFY